MKVLRFCDYDEIIKHTQRIEDEKSTENTKISNYAVLLIIIY